MMNMNNVVFNIKQMEKGENKSYEEKVKNIIMISIKYILVFIILIGIYIITLTVSSIIPSSALEKNVRKFGNIK